MLVAIFNTLDPQSLDTLYIDAVKYLREKEGLSTENQFIDPRQESIHDLRFRTAVRESGPALEFEDDTYYTTVLEETKNYFWLLWSLRDYFLEYIAALRNKNDRRFLPYEERWRIRDAIANAIAMIGVHHRPELKRLLDTLANYEETFIVITASTILRRLAETGQHDDFIVGVLTKWAQSKNFDQVWAACATITRFYSTVSKLSSPSVVSSNLQDALEQILTYISENYNDIVYDERRFREDILAMIQQSDSVTENDLHDLREGLSELVNRQIEFWRNQIRIALVFTLQAMSSAYPHRTKELLEEWLGPGKSRPLYEHARMGLNKIWEQSGMLKPFYVAHLGFPNIDLLPTTFNASQGITLDEFIRILSFLSKHEVMTDSELEGHRIVSRLLDKEPIDTATETMLEWYQILAHPQYYDDLDEPERHRRAKEGKYLWEQELAPKLLAIGNKITRSQRLRLCAALLNSWGQVGRTDGTVLRLMYAILRRSHLLNGEISLLPTTDLHGLVVVDGQASLKDKDFFKPILRFIRDIGGLIPLDIYRLGDKRQRFSVFGSPSSFLQQLYEIYGPSVKKGHHY